MGTVFASEADVAVFFVLGVILFADVFAGVDQSNQYAKNRYWYEAISRRIRGMPPPWLFGVAWYILYALLWASFFVFYRNTNFATVPDYLTTWVTLLFVFNMMANKSWSVVFFQRRQTLFALLLIVFIILTAVAILGLLGVNSLWVSFGLFVCYPLWCCYALYLNAMWYHVETAVLTPVEMEKLKQEPAPIVRANPNAVPVLRYAANPASEAMYRRTARPDQLRQRTNRNVTVQ